MMITPEGSDKKLDAVLVERIERLTRGYESLDYYGVLELGRDATPAEIKRAYHRLAKEFHPDRYREAGSDALREKLNMIFSYINEAYRELTGKADPSGTPSAEDEGGARRRYNKDLAKRRFAEGKRFFSAGRFDQAAVVFGQAVYLDDSEPEYHYLRAMSLLRVRKMKPAEESLKKAASLDPFNAKYPAELGFLYLELGFRARARSAFERALKFDPSDERAREGMNKLLS